MSMSTRHLFFLVLAQDDKVVKPLNSLVYYETLLRHGVQNCEMHIYSGGGHGFGLVLPNKEEQWVDRLRNWLTVINMLA